MKVLIAEDDPISVQVLARFLEKWGHDVVIAADGLEALHLLEQHPVALVISDWMMPRLDGLELVRRIRERPGSAYVYVILVTAKARKEDLIEGMEAGADDFLSKPFDREELRVRLRAGERIVRLEQNLARRNQELETANQRMLRDLEAAARIQQSLLPAAVPDHSQVRFAWCFRPCQELAGDLLGIVGLDSQNIGIYILDVSGHGVAAALSSVAVRHFLAPLPATASLLRQPMPGATGWRIAPPAEVADQLSDRFPMDLETGQYFTLLYGVLVPSSGTFRYVSAGHPGPIYLPHKGSAQQQDAPGFPIGTFPDARYREREIQLHPGDRLYLYSDGVPDTFNAAYETWGTRRLLQTLEECRTLPLQASLDTIENRLEAWRGTHQLMDDVSIVAVEMTG
jgi:sigma-B regulation protein RsbU (phosphoserine phosphatase)